MKVPSPVQYGFAVLAGLGLLAAIIAVFPGGPTAAQGILGQQQAPPAGDILDPPSAIVMHSILVPHLTQWGTLGINYTGTGPPGVTLQVTTPGNVLNWTIEAWVNKTSPPPTRLCASDAFYFGEYDWAFKADGSGSSGGDGTFVSTPTTVPARLGPTGDQCALRVAETGTWHLRVCVEGKLGGPRGYYRDAENRLHFDGYDNCIEHDYKVAPF